MCRILLTDASKVSFTDAVSNDVNENAAQAYIRAPEQIQIQRQKCSVSVGSLTYSPNRDTQSFRIGIVHDEVPVNRVTRQDSMEQLEKPES